MKGRKFDNSMTNVILDMISDWKTEYDLYFQILTLIPFIIIIAVLLIFSVVFDFFLGISGIL